MPFKPFQKKDAKRDEPDYVPKKKPTKKRQECSPLQKAILGRE